jgi:epsin
LDYLLKNGSDKVVGEARSRIYELKQLTRFNYIDSTGVDRGLSIRERTKQIIDLAQDTDRLKEERKTAKKVGHEFVTLT